MAGTKSLLPKLAAKKGEEDEDKDIEKIIQEDRKITETAGSKEVAEAVASVDPLDSPDFNPLDYINKLFPNGQPSPFP